MTSEVQLQLQDIFASGPVTGAEAPADSPTAKDAMHLLATHTIQCGCVKPAGRVYTALAETPQA
jgi:hypothetical protein